MRNGGIKPMRSEAQKAADRKYREAHKNDSVKWGTRLKAEEAAVYDAILQQHNMSRAEFIRRAFEELQGR